MFSSSNKQGSSINRRQFFTQVAQIAGAVVLAPTILKSVARAEEKRRGAKPDAAAPAGAAKEMSWSMAEPGKDLAGGMHYHHSKEEAKADKDSTKIEKSGVAWDSQQCANCSFYKKAGSKKVKVNGKEQEVEVGACTVIPQKLVASTGICNTWAKKA